MIWILYCLFFHVSTSNPWKFCVYANNTWTRRNMSDYTMARFSDGNICTLCSCSNVKNWHRYWTFTNKSFFHYVPEVRCDGLIQKQMVYKLEMDKNPYVKMDKTLEVVTSRWSIVGENILGNQPLNVLSLFSFENRVLLIGEQHSAKENFFQHQFIVLDTITKEKLLTIYITENNLFRTNIDFDSHSWKNRLLSYLQTLKLGLPFTHPMEEKTKRCFEIDLEPKDIGIFEVVSLVMVFACIMIFVNG